MEVLKSGMKKDERKYVLFPDIKFTDQIREIRFYKKKKTFFGNEWNPFVLKKTLPGRVTCVLQTGNNNNQLIQEKYQGYIIVLEIFSLIKNILTKYKIVLILLRGSKCHSYTDNIVYIN